MAARRRGRRGQGAVGARTGPVSATGWSRSSGCGRSTRSSSATGRARRQGTVGSLILGLYDADGELHVVGHSSGLKRGREAGAGRAARAVRDRRARPRRPEPLEEREGARVDRAAARARRRGHVRPRERRPDPPRHEDPALARGQGAGGVQARADVAVSVAGNDADVIVVGAGLAGLVATAELVNAGRRVILLDQEPEASLGGQAFWSLGGLFLVDSPEQRRMRHPAIRSDLALQDWLGSAGFDRARGRVAARGREAYVEFAAGEKRAGCTTMGVRFVSRRRAGPSAAATARPSTGTRCRAFTSPGAPGPASSSRSCAACARPQTRGLVDSDFRHRVDELIAERRRGDRRPRHRARAERDRARAGRARATRSASSSCGRRR